MTCVLQPGETQIGNLYYSCPEGYQFNSDTRLCNKFTSSNSREFHLISTIGTKELISMSELEPYRIYLTEIKNNTQVAIKYGQTEIETHKKKWCHISFYDHKYDATQSFVFPAIILENAALNWKSEMIATYELLANITDPCVDDAETQPYWSIVPEYNIMIKIDPEQPIKGEPLKEYIKTASANAIADVYRIKSTEIDSICVITKIDSITVSVPRIPEDSTLESISIYGELN